MSENRGKLTGIITEISESKQLSAYFKKRECKMRISDTDFTGKTIERNIKFTFINENCELLDMVRLDDTVIISYYLDGRDYIKDGKTLNFTVPTGFDIIVLQSPSRSSEETRNAVVTEDGLVFKEPEKIVTIKDLMNLDLSKYMVDPDSALETSANDKITTEEKNEPDKDLFNDLPF
jgi:hypothetical protein